LEYGLIGEARFDGIVEKAFYLVAEDLVVTRCGQEFSALGGR